MTTIATAAQIQAAIAQYAKMAGDPSQVAALTQLAKTNPAALASTIKSFLPANVVMPAPAVTAPANNPPPAGMSAQQWSQILAANPNWTASTYTRAVAATQASNQAQATRAAADKAAADKAAAAAAVKQQQADAAAAMKPYLDQLATVTTQDQLNQIVAQARNAGITIPNNLLAQPQQQIVDATAKATPVAPVAPVAPKLSPAEVQAAATAKAAKTQDYQTQLLKATTQDQLNSVLAQAKADGITLNQGYVDRATALVQQNQTKATAQALQARTQDYNNQVQSATSQDQIDSLIKQAQAEGVSVNPAYVTQAQNHIQQTAQLTDFASRLGTPTGSDVIGPNGSHFYSIAADPIAGTPGGWYQDTGSGNMQAIDKNGQATGPIIPNQEYNQQATTVRNNVAVFNQQQTATEAAQKSATDTAKFESALPAPGSDQWNYLYANRFMLTGPGGQTYEIVPTDTGRGGYWAVTTNGQDYRPVGQADAKPVTKSDINATYQQIADTQNQQAASNRANLIAQQQANLDASPIGDLFAQFDDMVNNTVGWKTIAAVAGSVVGGPLGAAIASATAGAVAGEDLSTIARGAAITFAMSYGIQALGDALSQTAQAAADTGAVDPAVADQLQSGVDTLNPDAASIDAANPPASVEPVAPVAPDGTAVPQPIEPVTATAPEPIAPEPVAPDGTAVPQPVEPVVQQPVAPVPNAGEIQMSDTGERFIVNADGSVSPYQDPNMIQTGNPSVTVSDTANYQPEAPTAEDLAYEEKLRLENMAPNGGTETPVAPTTGDIATTTAPVDPASVLSNAEIAALGGTAAAVAAIASSGAAGAKTAADTAIATSASVAPTTTAPVTEPVVGTPVSPTAGETSPITTGGTGTTSQPVTGGTTVAPGAVTAPAPVTTAPVAPAPVTTAPVAPAPVAPAPVTTAPVAPAPVAPAPVAEPISTVPEQGKPPSLGEGYTGNALEPTYTLSNGTPFAVGGLSPAQIAALVAAGYLLTSGAQPPTPQMPRNPYPIPHFAGGGLVDPGLNPGWLVTAVNPPMYHTTNPYQSQYYWGQHPHMQTASDLANYNAVPEAPAQPFGLQAGPNFNWNQYLTQLAATPAGPVAPVSGKP